MHVVPEVEHTGAVLLAESENASLAFVSAGDRHSQAPIPVHVRHMKAFRVPDVRLKPSESFLPECEQVEQVSQFTSVAPALRPPLLRRLLRRSQLF